VGGAAGVPDQAQLLLDELGVREHDDLLSSRCERIVAAISSAGVLKSGGSGISGALRSSSRAA